MKYAKFVLFCVLLLPTLLRAQDVYTSSGKPIGQKRANPPEKMGFNPDRMVYGGGLSLGLGGGGGYSAFQIGISPFAGYRITDRFLAGVGLGYQYQSVKNAFQNPSTGQLYPARYHFITPSIWARYGIFESIFLQGELEYNLLNYNELAFDASGNVVNQRKNVSGPALLLGGGFRQPISERASFMISVLYNVLHNSGYNPYQYSNNLVFRTGIIIGY
ncbi:MAG: hypothetical protein EOP52_02090 [Sphingobacteriales bacterium]|nr:MAG: hypothetical protein EOP52_02090 [Sphingobacteriales bacterium]